MPRIRNPFTPTFGMVPPFMAGRGKLLDEMSRAFEDGLGNPNLSTIIIGARGTGKTALLSCIAEEAQNQGWLSVNTIASDGLLEDIIQQAGKAASHLVEKSSPRKLSGIGIGQLLNLEWVFNEANPGNWRSRIEALLDKIEEYDTGLLITVDEVRVEIPEMIELVSTYQLLIREGKNISLVMAGLPANVTDLIGNERISFLRRARQHYIGRINDLEVAQAFRKTIEQSGKTINADAPNLATEAIRGFAYMIQLVGYFTWEECDTDTITSNHVSQGIALANEDFRHGVLDATYREMSEGDKQFAYAMLPDKNGSKLSDIAKRLGKGTNYASTYKARLLKQGIIGQHVGTTFDSEIPFFREYLEELAQEQPVLKRLLKMIESRE